MTSSGIYSLKQERLSAERHLSIIRILLAFITSAVLIKYFVDSPETSVISYERLIMLAASFTIFSVSMWILVKWLPEIINYTMVVGSFVEIIIITFLIQATLETNIPFYIWYIFYVVSVASRYGMQISILALSASIISFTSSMTFRYIPSNIDVTFMFGFIGFLLVLALMLGKMSEKQLNYQASLAVVNEFRAELAGVFTSSEVIELLVKRTIELLKVETSFFLPAMRGADASEALGLRSCGADPALMSAFRESGDSWNVEEILREQRPVFANNPSKSVPLSRITISRLGLRNIAAAPMMVRSVPVGVIYAVNKKDKSWSYYDMLLLELLATQSAPVVENALLWERLNEAAASEERLRIARDLHDTFLQTLTAMKLHLERCRILVRKDADKTAECIEKINEISTHGLAEVRAYLSELRMAEMEPAKFRQSVERCIEDSALRGGFEVENSIDLPDEALKSELVSAAFQVLRELLNNVISHSEAKKVFVSVNARDDRLIIEVNDNGVGFDVEKVRPAKAAIGHLGLIGVEERAKKMDGLFTISSKLGEGTKAVVTMNIGG